jgi:DnaJ like chaperone protein
MAQRGNESVKMLCCVRKAEDNRDVWQKLAQFLGSFSQRTGMAGHVANILDPDTWLPGGREAAFTLALIALSAKMAVADGAVTASEVRAFNATVEIAKGSEPQVERLFNLAKQDVAGYDAYARKVARFFADTPDTLEHVLDSLFFIATADGLVHEAELDYLREVSSIFGFDEARSNRLPPNMSCWAPMLIPTPFWVSATMRRPRKCAVSIACWWPSITRTG